MFKKRMALLLVGVVTTSMFAGCGAKNDTAKGEATTQFENFS
jgi:hypothetical protein